MKLYVSKRNLASHRIFDAEDNRESIEIDVTTLDEYFKEFEKPINFIKIDVEGAESAALLGASKTIENSKNHDIIILSNFRMLNNRRFPVFVHVECILNI